MLNNKKKKKGFTLIELIIVIAIIAILAAIAIPKFGDIRRNAALKSDVANAKIIANAASSLIADGKIKVPASTTTLNINVGASTGTTDAEADATAVKGYLQNVPVPKSSGYNNYKVTIDTEGNVTVKMDGKSGNSNGFELYPNTSTATP